MAVEDLLPAVMNPMAEFMAYRKSLTFSFRSAVNRDNGAVPDPYNVGGAIVLALVDYLDAQMSGDEVETDILGFLYDEVVEYVFSSHHPSLQGPDDVAFLAEK